MVQTISTIHDILSNTVWLFFLILGLWGVVRAIRGPSVDGSYLGALVIGQGLYMLQGIFGAILWSSGLLVLVPRPEMHVIYGSFAVVFMPFVYFVWLKGDDSNRGQWVLSLTTLALFGIALRAVATAG